MAEAPIWGLLIEPRKVTDAGLVCEPPRILGTTYPAGRPTGSPQNIDQRGPDLEHSACFSAFDLVEFLLSVKGFRPSSRKSAGTSYYPLPVTRDQLPVTSYQLPVTSYQLRVGPMLADHW